MVQLVICQPHLGDVQRNINLSVRLTITPLIRAFVVQQQQQNNLLQFFMLQGISLLFQHSNQQGILLKAIKQFALCSIV